jgi:8-oxo-dGTP diphosphatase
MQSSQSPDPTRYQFISRVLVFLTRGDEILLIKRAADKKLWPGLYNGLGGHVERGESVYAAAAREVEEESGLTDLSLWLCAVVAIDTGETASGILMFVFHGETEGELRPSAEGALEWASVDKVSDLPLVEDIPDLLPRVLDRTPKDPPLWGLYTYDSSGNLSIRFDGHPFPEQN